MSALAPLGLDAPPGAQASLQAPTGSSFYLGLRILPREQREAMYAIYAFCRAVDDIADTDGPVEQRLGALARWSEAIDDLFAARALAPGLEPLSDAVRRFGLREEDFGAILDGMRMDIGGEAVRPDKRSLDLYCDRVACAPGRLSVRVFGLSEEAGLTLADHLGRALQLTNILRDIDEDAALGRLYLPRELLAAAGLGDHSVAALLGDPRLSQVCLALADEARMHFVRADAVMAAASRDQVRAPRLMAAAYRPVLERLVARGWAPPRGRVSKRKRDLMGAVLRFGIF